MLFLTMMAMMMMIIVMLLFLLLLCDLFFIFQIDQNPGWKMCGRWFSVIYLYYWFLLLSLFKIIEYPGVEYITNISEPIVLLLILR